MRFMDGAVRRFLRRISFRWIESFLWDTMDGFDSQVRRKANFLVRYWF